MDWRSNTVVRKSARSSDRASVACLHGQCPRSNTWNVRSSSTPWGWIIIARYFDCHISLYPKRSLPTALGRVMQEQIHELQINSSHTIHKKGWNNKQKKSLVIIASHKCVLQNKLKFGSRPGGREAEQAYSVFVGAIAYRIGD